MQPRILVVDDSEDLRDVYVDVLSAAGYRVASARDGVEGFAQARALRPDLVISDIVMPGMDGFALIEKLKSDLSPPVPPVILSSGFDVTEAEALRRGALMFLEKPFERADLLEYVEKALKHERVSSQLADRGRRHSQSVRRCTREIAAAVVNGMEARAPGQSFAAIVSGPLEWLRTYFGFAQADMFLVEADRLRCVAHAGSEATRPDLGKAQTLREFQDVIESGSTLVVADVARHPCFQQIAAAMPRAAFFAGAPLSLDDGTPVGMVCLADTRPRNFPPEDLSILQTVAQRGSLLLGALAGGKAQGDLPVSLAGGVLAHDMLARLIGYELSLLAREGGSMALSLVEDLEEWRGEVVAEALRGARDRRRLAAGLLSCGRVAVVHRATGADAATEVEEVVGELLLQRGPSAAVGIVEISGTSMPHFDGVDLLRFGELALERAIDDGTRRVLIDVSVRGPRDQDELLAPGVER